jgi:hypothetical protein
MTAGALRSMNHSASMQFGGHLYQGDGTQPFAEVDLLLISKSGAVVAECKSCDQLTDEDQRDIISSAGRAAEACVAVGSQSLIIGLTTRADPTVFRNKLQQLGEDLTPIGVGVHLLVNGQLHVQCGNQPHEPRAVSINDLQVTRGERRRPPKVGQLRNRWGPRLDSPINYDALSEWEAGLSDTG